MNTKTSIKFYVKTKERTLRAITAVAMLLAAAGCGTNPPKTDSTAPKQSSYTAVQQVFCLNMLSNISAHYNRKNATIISDSTRWAVKTVLGNDGVSAIIGSWQCVWGPVVIASKPKSPDSAVANNTMYIARSNADTTLYVVAIAGTNPLSKSDWLYEDLAVPMVPWFLVTGPLSRNLTGMISLATYNGIAALKGMHDSTLPGSPTAAQFLEQKILADKKTQYTVWVTGHSLGGALSPTYAMYLHDTWPIELKLTPNYTINCLAVAGATPGNDTFSQNYTAALGNNTVRVWNRRDIVPHGFDTTMLRSIDTIYNSDPNPAVWTPQYMQQIIGGTIATLKKYNLAGYTQLLPANTGFLSGYYDSTLRISPNSMKDTFTTEAICQHIPAYAQYFGVIAFQNQVQTVLNLPYPFFSQGYHAAPILDSGAYPQGVRK